MRRPLTRLALAASLLIGCTLVAGNNRQAEVCGNGVDDDFDGRPDCTDRDCHDRAVGACAPLDFESLPLLSPACRGGWVTALTGGRLEHCEPWEAGAWQDCGEERFDGSRCTSVGTGDTCDRPSFGVAVYVQTGATDGDGSEDRPLGSIAEALALEPSIVIFEGQEEELVILDRPVRLIGVCPTAAWLAGGVVLGADGARVENVRIGSDAEGDVLTATADDTRAEGVVVLGDVRLGGSATLEGSLVTGGVHTPFGDSVLDRCEVRGASERRCLEASELGQLEVLDSTLARCPRGALEARDEGFIGLTHVVLDDLSGSGVVAACDDGEACVGLFSSLVRRVDGNAMPALDLRSGQMAVTNSYVSGGRGVLASVSGGALTLGDSAIDGTPVSPMLDAGLVIDGGEVEASDSWVGGGSLVIDLVRGALRARGLTATGGNRPPEQIGGIRAAGGTVLSLLGGFRVDFADPCALRLEEGVALAIQAGTITEVVDAICAPAGAYDEIALASDLTIDESTGIFRPL